MSRLPRLHSSPDRLIAPSISGNITTRSKILTTSTSTHLSVSGGDENCGLSSSASMKRKSDDMDELELEMLDQPRKLPAISSGLQRPGFGGPLRPSRNALNVTQTSDGSNGLSQSQIGKPVNSSRTRATSAPPKSISSRPNGGATRGKAPVGRSVSGGPQRPIMHARSGGGLDEEKFRALQQQVESIESARAADSARLAAEMEAEREKLANLQENHKTLSKELAGARTQELAQRRELVTASVEIENIKRMHAREVEDLTSEARRKDRELRELKDELMDITKMYEAEKETASALKATVAQQSAAQFTLKTQNEVLSAQLSALRASLDYSSADASQVRLELESARARISSLEEELHKAETTRRKLHNLVQELKGNIRVFCRVRPLLPSDLPPEVAQSILPGAFIRGCNPDGSDDTDRIKSEYCASIAYPDKRDRKEIVLCSSSENAMGQERKEMWNFSFDRVFEPCSTQSEVFEEISQLAQSCIDGYNVCIFAYGQTGSGKSFTMEGGSTSESLGMIPRAVEQVFRVADVLRKKGWDYKMEGQFLEIYNETINDLLGKGEFDKKKHEIKHDKGTTRVTDVEVVPLKTANQVRSLLLTAQSRRTVAATLMNERSSRSHSVFTLRISGTNTHTGEKSEGTLNLVDLAGSERLNSSGAGSDKDRLKETQNINRSLSALADVIAALGEKSDKSDKHIPYRNSKLTYLLQNSLSGNSKTLMMLNLSPLAAHLGESLCSLRFATKVNNTTIGTAKRQIRVSS